MGISNLTGKRLKCVKQSAVSDHLLECNCSIDFDHFDILASDANKFRLLINAITSANSVRSSGYWTTVFIAGFESVLGSSI